MQIIVDVKQMAGAIKKMPQYQELRAKCVCACAFLKECVSYPPF
jgi:hypothetical protein